MSEAASATAVTALEAPARLARRRPSFRAVFGLTVLLIMSGAAVLAPQFPPWNPARQLLMKRLRPPAWEPRGRGEHRLGTDHPGRATLSATAYAVGSSLAWGRPG